MASAELAVDNKSDQTPLARERQHAQDESEGRLRFVVVKNDGLDRSLISLIDMKSIYSKQLPKMGKEYIVRLVLDRSHTSLACVFEGEIVGGVTYRRHATQAFAEIAFCAVSATHQVRGYGTRLMNQLKEHCKREGIHFLLTYADNHAIGYFRKQGFQKQVTMKRERWLGYIKDYDGGTLMECAIDTQVDYLNIRFVAEEQRRAIAERMEAGGAQQQEAEYTGYDPAEGGVPAGLQGTWWRESALHCSMQGRRVPLADCLQAVLAEVATHADAWPFQTAVSTTLAPDYYEVIKDPVDLASVRARLTPRAGAPPHYNSLDQFLADLLRMCENCRVYNGDNNEYYDCAVRLEAFVRKMVGEVSVSRVPVDGTRPENGG